MNALRLLSRRLASDQRGSIAISFAMVFALMVGSTVFAVDMARYNIAQSRMQNALDLTLISVGRNLPQYQINLDGDEGDALRKDVDDYFYANFPASFLSSSVNEIVVKQEPDPNCPSGQTIQLATTGTLPMLSTGFFDLSAMNLQAKNGACRRIRANMEMVLALDNSSTVNVGTQEVEVTAADNALMDTLIAESKKLTSTVLNAAATTSGTGPGQDSGAYVGLVPFTDFVNVRDIGPVEGWLRIRPQQKALISGLQRPNGTYTTPVWKGCISEPLPVGGSWSGSPSLPVSVLTPSPIFQPAFTVFGHTHDVKELLGKEPDGFLVKSSESPFPAPIGLEPFYGPDFVQHDWSDTVHPPRAAMVWPYKKDWGPITKGTAAQHRGLPAHAEPQHFWISFATDSTYISGMAGSAKIGACLYSRVKFLTYDQAALNTAIDSMKKIDTVKIKGADVSVYGYGGGSTIPVGLLWSWRMLSPTWRGTEGWGSDVLPQDGVQGLRKIIVLFANRGNYPLYKHASDGNIKQPLKLGYDYKVNPSAETKTIKVAPINLDIDLTSGPYAFTQCPLNGLRSHDFETITPENYSSAAQSPECPFTSTDIGYGNDGGSGLTTATVNDYMADVCNNIKADQAGIEIYTITLGGAAYSTDTKPLIQSCASSPDKYFDAANVKGLSEAFKTIAGNVTDFRLTQ